MEIIDTMVNRGRGQLRAHFFIGLSLIAWGETLVVGGIQPLVIWAYPIFWYGYILFLDASLYSRKGFSPIKNRPREFAAMLPISSGVWFLFEWYNLYLKNWHYVNLPPQPWIALVGFFVSFATVIPGVFFTSELFQDLLRLDKIKVKPRVLSRGKLVCLVVSGAFCLTVPLMLPSAYSVYLFGFVWVGFVFLLDPVNFYLRGESLLGDLAKGRVGRASGLLIGGTVCGFLWEFWNYWGYTKWVYDAPITSGIKLFEMPVLGYLGFPAFALELFAIYAFLKLLYSYARRAKG